MESDSDSDSSDDSSDDEERDSDGDGDHSDGDDEDDDDDDEDKEDKYAKSLPVALREFHSKRKQVLERMALLQVPDPVHDKKLEGMMKKLSQLRVQVFKSAKKEANRFVRRIFDLPCEEAPLDSYCTIGKVLERSFIKEKTDVESYTHCPSCGCLTVFRTDMIYANGNRFLTKHLF